MGNLVETGLGWYLDEDYLLTLGSQQLGTVTSGGGQGTFFDIPNLPTNLPVNWPNIVSNGAISVYATGASGTNPIWTVVVVSDWNGTLMPVHCYAAWITSRSELLVFFPRGDSSVPTSVANFSLYWSDNINYWGSQADTMVVDNKVYLVNVSIAENVVAHPGVPNYATREDAIRDFAGSVVRTVTKVQGGAGAFAMVSYPKDGDTVYVGVGISSIPNPNSAATVAVDGTNGSYDTFNRETINFTMFYTPELSGTLSSNVPVVTISDELDTSSPLYTVRLFLAVANAAQIHAGPAPQSEDPYEDGGTSGPSDGTPDFTETSESISPGSTFPISFQSTGLCRVYVPSITNLNDLANYLWTDQTFLDTIKNILINQFENFMEAVISLTMVPCQVPAGTAQPVKVMFLPTGLSFPPATQQFVEVDCGYVDITERYASALDYNPYTKVSLYLPFIGTVPLDTDEVMGHRVKCVYTIDIVSGACVAKIMVNYPDSSNGVLYQFSGHCSISMPLTAADFSSYYAAAMSGLKMAAGLAAAGAGAPGLAGTLLGEPTAHPSSTTTTTRTTERNAATGRQILTGTESRETSHTPGQASFKELATRASVNTVGAVINSKFSVEHSGGFTGNTGFLGVQAPYVIITRPDMCNPNEYGAYNGRPSMMYLHLGSLSGFTQVQNIKLTGIPATNPELGEIAELLKTGVIL